MVIGPTGTCFDDVLDHQGEMPPEVRYRQFIVHGICLIPDDQVVNPGELYAHAWVEDDLDHRVWQSGLLEDGTKVWWGLDREEYYRTMRVQERTRYTWTEALELNFLSNHFGPWIEKYRVLCKNKHARQGHA